jgi:hypothetical protein
MDENGAFIEFIDDVNDVLYDFIWFYYDLPWIIYLLTMVMFHIYVKLPECTESY